MRISYYTHAWQAVLMMLAGVMSVVGSLAGYLSSGGGDELLQQSLVSFFPKVSVRHGGVMFDTHSWSKITVINLQSDPITDGSTQVKGLKAERCEINLDLWPWPPRIASVHVYGIREIEITLEPGYLQDVKPKIAKGPEFPVYFHEVTAGVKIGNGPLLKFENCGGVIQQLTGPQSTPKTAKGEAKEPNTELVGRFSLSRLNGKPFDISVECLKGNRWETHGNNLEIDTQILHVAPEKLSEAVEPVTLLLRALLTGEMGSQGKVPSLRVAVEPADEGRPFACEGLVGYENLELRLPPAKNPAATAVPFFLDWMFFGEKSIWPPWLLPDSIKTGDGGRLAFHMIGNRLEFDCDEGPGSAFIVTKRDSTSQVQNLSIESLKGSIITDSVHRPKAAVLRGILAGLYNGELRMERSDAGVRTFELRVDPRANVRDAPLWRFRTRVEDYSESLAQGAKGDWGKFEVEFASQDTPASALLPPGVRDLSGRFFVRGRFGSDRVLELDEISWKKGTLTYGGQEFAAVNPLLADIYGRVFESLRRMWGGPSSEWNLQEMDVTGKMRVRFDEKYNWQATEVFDWKLGSGIVSYKGMTSDFGAAGIELRGHYKRESGGADEPQLLIEAGPREHKTGKLKWSMRLECLRLGMNDSEIRFIEDDVPLKMHPERETIPSKFIDGWIDKIVKRTHVVRFVDGKPVLEIKR